MPPVCVRNTSCVDTYDLEFGYDLDAPRAKQRIEALLHAAIVTVEQLRTRRNQR
jgi:hypothetical protein